MRPYSMLTWNELKTRMDSSPPDTPDYQKAKEERDYRTKRIAIFAGVGGTLVMAAVRLFLK